MGVQKYTIEKVKEILKDKNIIIDENTFSLARKGFVITTNDGYKAVMNDQHLRKNILPEFFHKNNPYTLDNIKNYIKVNNIETKLLSTAYHNNSDDLKWECECGNCFFRSWNGFLQGATLCLKCSVRLRGLKQRTDIEIVKNTLNGMGLFLLEEPDAPIFQVRLNVIDNEGYKYDCLWCDIKSSKFPQKFHPSNKYTIENINHYLELERNGEYKCVSTAYKRNNATLQFLHISCGHIFSSSLVAMQGKNIGNTTEKYYKQCPKCSMSKTESIHASILKQVFIHEYPDTITEEKSCINPKTNYPLPTDIVNHNLKIAIEIQSGYHDLEDKKVIDKFKKNYWINRGYSFYDPDIRDYTFLGLIQLFFPQIEKIPDYIDYNYSNCVDANKVQQLLDEGYSFKEIAVIMDKKYSTVSSLVFQKKVIIPKDYDERILNRKPVIRLTKKGEYIKRYKNLSAITEDDMAIGTVVRVLKGKQKFSYDSFWVYEQDYLNGNYTLPEEDFDHFLLPVDKYSMDDNYICSYDTIYEAENDSLCSRNDIYRVARGKCKSSHKEKWKFKAA